MADSEDFKQMYWEMVGYNVQLKKRIAGLENKGTIGFSFTEEQRTEFIETTIFLNSQNLSGRETEDEERFDRVLRIGHRGDDMDRRQTKRVSLKLYRESRPQLHNDYSIG